MEEFGLNRNSAGLSVPDTMDQHQSYILSAPANMDWSSLYATQLAQQLATRMPMCTSGPFYDKVVTQFVSYERKRLGALLDHIGLKVDGLEYLVMSKVMTFDSHIQFTFAFSIAYTSPCGLQGNPDLTPGSITM